MTTTVPLTTTFQTSQNFAEQTALPREQMENSGNQTSNTTETIHANSSWTSEEDEMLRGAVFKHGGKKWKVIAAMFKNRTPTECNSRWNELQNHGSAVKKPWSPGEDMLMLELVLTHGAGKWAVIASYLPGRNGKQCRERWHNQLNPAIKKGPWTAEEDRIIMEMQAKYGNRWAKITEMLPGRTDNAVKNHWHSSMKSKLKRSAEQAYIRDGIQGASSIVNDYHKRVKKIETDASDYPAKASLSVPESGTDTVASSAEKIDVDGQPLDLSGIDPASLVAGYKSFEILDDSFGVLHDSDLDAVPHEHDTKNSSSEDSQGLPIEVCEFLRDVDDQEFIKNDNTIHEPQPINVTPSPPSGQSSSGTISIKPQTILQPVEYIRETTEFAKRGTFAYMEYEHSLPSYGEQLNSPLYASYNFDTSYSVALSCEYGENWNDYMFSL